jgi:hypothetical protein
MRIKQRDQIWLVIIGILSTIAFLAATPEVALVIRAAAVAAFVAAVGIVIARPSLEQIRQQISTAAAARPNGSKAAQEAVQRAAARGEVPSVDLELTDIGLIASESGYDGVTFRRTRDVSNDDDGVRPYVQLKVGALNAERRALLRYELIDPTGETAFVHEEKVYLQLGENTLHPDQHLPLAGSLPPDKLGRWDLHTFVDGRLLGMLTFTVTPTDDERVARLSGQRGEPDSFEDLLRRGGRSREDDRR